ncbi:autotransporter outer membrane beta-barrel domain-containing protein, partial [Ralstonia pseudosolanacearum]
MGLLTLSVSSQLYAQTVIGPGASGGITVTSGTTSVVGGTTIAGGGTAVSMSAGALNIDSSAGPSPGAIAINATAFNAFSIYATGGTITMPVSAAGISMSTAGAAAAALWTQNTGTSFVSSGGLTLRTTGGYGIVNGLPVGSYGAVASHNSSISLTDATIATTG